MQLPAGLYSLNEILRTNLQELCSLHILHYATAAFKLTKAQILDLNDC